MPRRGRARIALNRRVLDAAVSDMNDLKRRLGHTDRQRVEQYLSSIREVEKRLDERDAILKKGRPAFDEASVRIEPKSKMSMRAHIDLMMAKTKRFAFGMPALTSC